MDITSPVEYFSLTNDKQRIECALRLVINEKQMEDIEKIPDLKSNSVTDDYIKKGDLKFRSGKYVDAWAFYTEAIKSAKPNSLHLARAYERRSETFFKVNAYANAWEDARRGLVIAGNDKTLMTKLRIYYTENLIMIRSREIFGDVQPDMVNIDSLLNEIDDEEIKHSLLDPWNNSLQLLPTLRTPLDTYRKRVRLSASHSKILTASGAIELKYSHKKFGRHVVAARDIRKDEVLKFNRVFTTISASELINRQLWICPDYYFCWNCSKLVASAVACSFCISAVYCNEDCRNKAWEDCHELECRVISALLKNNSTDEVLLSVRLTVKAIKEAGSIEALKKNLHRIDSTLDPIEKFLVNESFDSSKYASVYALLPPTHEISVPWTLALQSARTLIYFSRLTKLFGNELTNNKELLERKDVGFVALLIMKNLKIANKFKLKQYYKDTTNQVPWVIDPLLSLFNHSCDANAHLQKYRNYLILTACKDIPKGQQIFISYDNINCTTYTFSERSQILPRKYDFWCDCRACLLKWPKKIN